ncbi:WG containing repeat-containing protein [Sporobacter termitidis DSM 10068]|uniref:WG containing repeat-containing protein n=1 Tax=Sporobacter termitidis DSM 10068 TaxID=1123282 RepID=A0A1M5Z8N9_9FIRM|nr:WG repeat-containing protein [Sporobacter termitidis]SHI20605.1 WG containing repeat-containing protein [Sporobacter termitidis DSM 10068]
MKQCIRQRIAALVLLPALTLAACAQLPASDGRNTQSPPSPAVTDWHSGVKTDYSGLTPYKPPEEKYTRLSDGPLPGLQPSGNYGQLLPYLGETMYRDGGAYRAINMYGLVTENAEIVTDPVYTNVYTGQYFDIGKYAGAFAPAYDLEKVADDIDRENPWNSERHAACALDGSWVTPFDYIRIYFTDKVFMGMRDAETNDFDILDYSGKLLYNTKSLGCYKYLSSKTSYMFSDGYGEGLIGLPLSDGRTVYIDALTGKETYTDYADGGAFIGGRARVTQDGLIGFIDRSFQLVIKPQYTYAAAFVNGRNIVQLQDDSYAVIDDAGKILFQNKNMITQYDAKTYGVYDSSSNSRYYGDDFKELAADGHTLTPLYDGWFYYTTDIGAVLLNGSEKHLLGGVKNINFVSGGLVGCYDSGKDVWSEGIMTLEGKEVVPLTQNVSPTIVTSKKTGDVYIILTSYAPDGSNQTYAVMTKDGQTIFFGKGAAYCSEQCDLLEVRDEQSFGYMDLNGNCLFKISLLRYLPD